MDGIDPYDDGGAPDGGAPEAVPLLAASEAELVGLARALIVGHPADVAGRLGRISVMPPVISTACEQMLGDALAQVWPALWRRGGTAPVTGLGADGAPRRGRLWERHAPAGLTFSPMTLQLLRWLVGLPEAVPRGTVVRSERRTSRVLRTPRARGVIHGTGTGTGHAGSESFGHIFDDAWPRPTLGDQVMLYLALAATAGSPIQARLAALPAVQLAPLVWLGFPALMAADLRRAAERGPDADTQEQHPASAAPDLDGLVRGAGAVVVEALAGELARRWRTIELAKRTMVDPRQLIALGTAQDFALETFMAACDRHGRRDLAGFVIDAAAPLIARDIAPVPAQLDRDATLAIRAEARVAAGALLRGVLRWAVWDDAHRGVRFLDDDYAASQVLLARFEPIGAAGTARAAAWLADLAALAPTAG